jgi:hypothetical protein
MTDARPYRTPDASIRPGAWTIKQDGADMPLPEWMPSWDLSQNLTASRRLIVDVGLLRSETQLPPTARLALSVACVSDFEIPTTYRELADGDDDELTLELEVPGTLLGGTANFRTSLVITDHAAQRHEAVAFRRGSVLWQDMAKVRLYGDSGRFPMIVADFAECGFDVLAPWFVEVEGDLEQPAMGSIVLYLNERFPRVVEAARNLDPERDDLRLIRSALYADTGRVLVENALTQHNIHEDWPDESLGRVLRSLLGRFNEPLGELRSLRTEDPSRWASKLQARFGLFKESTL